MPILPSSADSGVSNMESTTIRFPEESAPTSTKETSSDNSSEAPNHTEEVDVATEGCRVCMPPDWSKTTGLSVFLAGSIDMGKARDWQSEVTAALSQLPLTVFNPRRKDWDSSWEQKATNAKFKEQVEWELQRLEEADVIALYFEAGSMSPISLLELGLHARSRKLIVYCPEGFYRKGNVDVTCGRYGVPVVESVEEFVLEVKKRLVQSVKFVV
jgi:nucleoside 2-deoxyribosyltransferase-like protein